MENGNGKKTEHRITTLEVKVDSILENHLPHLQRAVDDIKGKQWWLISMLIVALIGIIASYFK